MGRLSIQQPPTSPMLLPIRLNAAPVHKIDSRLPRTLFGRISLPFYQILHFSIQIMTVSQYHFYNKNWSGPHRIRRDDLQLVHRKMTCHHGVHLVTQHICPPIIHSDHSIRSSIGKILFPYSSASFFSALSDKCSAGCSSTIARAASFATSELRPCLSNFHFSYCRDKTSATTLLRPDMCHISKSYSSIRSTHLSNIELSCF
jgi:hypothetical protein